MKKPWTRPIRCDNPVCGHRWDSKSKMIYVSCPSCHRSVKTKGVSK